MQTKILASIFVTFLLMPTQLLAAIYPITFTEITGKEIVGGFFSPDLKRVASLNPDLIFYSTLHKEIEDLFKDKAVLVNIIPRSINDSLSQIWLLDRIFQRQTEAEAVNNWNEY